jgi:phosphoglucosamine mutase
MNVSNVIVTSLGIRGRTGELTPNMVLKFAEAFGTIVGNGKNILIARDTRITSRMFRNEVINGLISVGVNVYNLGVAPSPCLLYNMQNRAFSGGIMITGSHLAENWNGIKFIDGETKTYITTEYLKKVKAIHDSLKFAFADYNNMGNFYKYDGLNNYIHGILDRINIPIIKRKKFKIVLDPVAGCGLTVTPQLFIRMRCKTQIINDSMNSSIPYFPRKIEPTPENLGALSKAVVKSRADIGFAHDLDADRVAIAENGTGKILPEDLSLAIIVKDYLENHESCTLVVNVASSKIFHDLAKKFHADYEEVKVGEVYVATRLNELLKKKQNIIGGEGSCGGIMIPAFNNARDGPLACAKILEIMAKNDMSISELVKKLPKYYLLKEKIRYPHGKYKNIIEALKDKYSKNYEINSIDGVKFSNKSSWFLVRASGTEPIMRIFIETEKESKSKKLANEIMELINGIISESPPS